MRRAARVAGAGKRNWGTAGRPLVLAVVAIPVGTAVNALTPTAATGRYHGWPVGAHHGQCGRARLGVRHNAASGRLVPAG